METKVMDREEIERLRDGLQDTLNSITSGELSAKPEAHAYFLGAVETLNSLLDNA